MIFANRTRRRPDRYLRWKIGALVIGAVLILWGSRSEQSWPVWVGIAALALAFVLRVLPQPARGGGEGEEADKEQEAR